MSLDIESAGGGAILPSRKPYTLQPVNYGPYAAWSLEQPNGSSKLDRSGNSRHLGGLFTFGEDIQSPIPLKSAFAMNGQRSTANGPLRLNGCPSNDFVTNGITITAWVLRSGRAQNSYSECWASGWQTDSNGVILPLYYEDSLNGRIYSYTNGGFANSGMTLGLGRWKFVAVSIASTAAGGQCIQGVDGTYVTTPSVGLTAVPGNPSQFCLGAATYTTDYGRQMCGGLFDVMLWQKPLTQAQLELQRQTALRG